MKVLQLPHLEQSHRLILLFLLDENQVRSKTLQNLDIDCPKSYNKDFLRDLSKWGYILKLPNLSDMREVRYQMTELGRRIINELLRDADDLQRTRPIELKAHI